MFAEKSFVVFMDLLGFADLLRQRADYYNRPDVINRVYTSPSRSPMTLAATDTRDRNPDAAFAAASSVREGRREDAEPIHFWAAGDTTASAAARRARSPIYLRNKKGGMGDDCPTEDD